MNRHQLNVRNKEAKFDAEQASDDFSRNKQIKRNRVNIDKTKSQLPESDANGSTKKPDNTKK